LIVGSGVNSGGGALQASLRNPLGYGEVCKLSLGSNTSEGQECSLVTMVPHFSFPNPNATLIRPIFHSIFGSKSLSADGKMAESVKSDSTQRGTLQFSFKKSEENNSHFVSFKSLLHTIGTEFTSDNGVHSISTEITVRDELPISHRFQPQSNILRDFQKNLFSKNPIAVREVPCVYNAHAKTASKETLSNLSSSSKTALQYTYLKDCRNTSNPILGSYLKSSIEVALPSGSQSAQYVRTDVMMQNNFRVIPFEGIDTGMTASYSGSIGKILDPQAADIVRLSISYRLTLGLLEVLHCFFYQSFGRLSLLHLTIDFFFEGALWPLPGVNRLHAFLVDRYSNYKTS
jgi:hypothetical protein